MGGWLLGHKLCVYCLFRMVLIKLASAGLSGGVQREISNGKFRADTPKSNLKKFHSKACHVPPNVQLENGIAR